MNPIYLEFGQLVASKRREHRLSQSALGSLVGLSRTSITNIEKGRQPVQLHQLFQFVIALQVPIDEILPKAFIDTRQAVSHRRDRKKLYAQELRQAFKLGE
jgi:transcriptional regulator with XRE-family HTH domain